jgi:flavin-dependent dehydrogenase
MMASIEVADVYDAIVVGGRCAGAPTAMLLARQGHRVLLVDRARFPSDKPVSTHLIVRSGGGALGRWGLLDRVAKLGAPPMPQFALDVGPLQVISNSPDDGEAQAMYAPRRYLFDALLLDAAREAGVEIREGFSVRELVRDDDGRVVGVRGGARNEPSIELRARIVVGADGIGSVVAREVGAKAYLDVPTKTGTWWGYFHGVPIEHVHIWIRPRRLFCAARTNDDLTIVMAYSAIEDFHEFSADPEGNFSRELAEHIPGFYERFRVGEREGQLLGTGYQPNYLRQAAGRGWALVGDAGMHHDSINPSGMSKALTTAEMLAEAIHEGLAGSDADLDATVQGYQARRDARWLPHWHAIVSFFANMEPPTPERFALIGALAASPELAKRFFAFFQGQAVELGFMDPENLARVVGAPPPPA